MIKFGTDKIEKIYIGTDTVKYMYLGGDLVFSNYAPASWIKLGSRLRLYNNIDSNVEIQMRFNRLTSTNYLYYAFYSGTSTYCITAYYWKFGTGGTLKYAPPQNTWTITKQNKDGVWANNTKQGSYSSTADFTSDSIYISNTIRIDYFKIYNNGTLTMDLRAVKQLSTGYYGLLDKVSGKFYGDPNNTGQV